MAEINVGDNANLLKGAIDSHDVQTNYTTNKVDNSVDNSVTNNTTNNSTNYTTNNKTVYEAQRTQQEILQDNENQFIKAVRERVADGLTRQKEAELEQIARDWKISPLRAYQIIEAERKSADILNGGQGKEYYASKILQNVYDAVNANQPEILKRLFIPLEELSKTMDDGNLQYYYYLLFASLNPAGCTVSFVNHHTDNYWQLFWTCIAYIKIGQVQNAIALIPRLGGFGGPHGDIDLLTAVENLLDFRRTKNEYYSEQMRANLQSAVSGGLSELLSPLWYAIKELANNEQHPEKWFAFYVETTIKELGPEKVKQINKDIPQMPTPPPMPKFDPQSVNLAQSQGFNALQAAQQMGLGRIPSPSRPQMPSMNMPSNDSSMSSSELVIPESSTFPQERISQYGILFTDSAILGEKYNCEVQDVINVLNEFIQSSAEADMHWYLLDVADYRMKIGDNSYWGTYNDLLADYIAKSGFQIGLATPVFILGGSDVIPVPQIENPLYGGVIPTDMSYCFDTSFFSDLWEGDHTITVDYVRNTIARLPLESGKMQTSLQDDLVSYFNLCSIVGDGIDVEGVTMASNVAWANNSATMSQHLPLIHIKSNDDEEIHRGMYMCPKLVAVESDSSPVDKKVLADYQMAIQRAGMLLFNLHGSDSKDRSGFYCEDGSGYPESFNIELMKQSNARVFNTVACFGARYDNFERYESMLLSALYGGGKLLYTGSSVAVPMISDEEQNYPIGVPQYPGSGSEKFMPLYCYYQFCGLPAGQAMMQAKLDYFNTFRHIERDDFSLSTIMMFGLYGNPMLHVKARQDVMDAAQRYEILPQLTETKSVDTPIHMKRIRCLISKQQLYESKSLFDQLRNCVDDNLKAIHGMMQQMLYQQLGLEPRWLDEVDEYTISNDEGGVDNGYVYCYDLENKYGHKSLVEVSKQGKITRKVTFK